MTIIFDLDYTLFDTRRFKKELARALEISFKMYNNDYDKYFKQTQTNYSLTKHLSILGRRKEATDKKKINKNLDKLWLNIDKFLFSNADTVLKSLKKKNYQLILVTFGEKGWQKEKVKNLKIKKYFDQIYFCDKDKSSTLRKFKKQTNISIVNDKVRECKIMKKILPQAKIFVIKGPYSKNIKHNFLNINLRTIEKYL